MLCYFGFHDQSSSLIVSSLTMGSLTPRKAVPEGVLRVPSDAGKRDRYLLYVKRGLVHDSNFRTDLRSRYLPANLVLYVC